MPTKAAHRKSRNGCLNCKSKRIKCDQKSPSCTRCEERGVECPGYALNLRWAPKNQLHTQRLPTSSFCPNPMLPHARLERNSPLLATTGPEYHTASLDSQPFDDSWFARSPRSLLFGSPTPARFQDPSDAWSYPDSMDGLLQAPSVSPLNPLLPGQLPLSIHEPRIRSWPQSQTPTELIWDTSLPQAPGLLEIDEIEDEYEDDVADNDETAALQAVPTSHGVIATLETEASQPRSLVNMPSALCEYFFKEIISLYCAWDGQSNIMRRLTESMWQSSGVLYHTIQSMAAACLAKTFPELKLVAAKEHSKARQYLGALPNIGFDEDKMLASFLLGHTTSWINPNTLATDSYEAALVMLDSWAAGTVDHTNLDFYGEAMDYWAMLLCFLTETKLDRKYSRRRPAFAGPIDPVAQIKPHPFTGISTKIVQILTDTGLLVFRFRQHQAKTQFLSEKDLDFFRDCIREARSIERRLLAYSLPNASDILDPGDPKTTPAHFVHLDEAYRCTGLLQLYRIFPDLLNERYNPWKQEDLFHPQAPSKTPSRAERDAWLTSLAMHIIEELRQIPFESSTRCLQPFILVAISSELRRDTSGHVASAENEENGRPHILSQASFELARARNFALSRLSAYMHILPLRKVSMFQEMVTSIWSALDSGEDVHWTDICKKMRLETLIG